ncbi:MAG: hypothetical protein VKL42_04855, partial [Snowella sp.]|nr:hypothetical protein [Snowella sp.]
MVKVKWRELAQIPLQIGKTIWKYLLKPVFRLISPFFSLIWQRIQQDREFAVVLILTLTLIFTLIFGAILPVNQPFEGNLLVNSLGFTNQKNGQLLLKNVEKIQEISLAGKQGLTLSGTITNSNHPELNQKQELQIEILKDNEHNGQITITPKDSLTLREIRLQENDIIEDLTYAPFTKILKFYLRPANPAQPPRFLLNASSIQINLSDYQLKNIKLKNPENPLEFTLETTQFELTPQFPVDVNLTLPSKEQANIFWGNISVETVKFKELIQTGDNSNDNIIDSTILSGDIRMVNQDLKLEENQFLIIYPPGIQTLSRIQIIRPDPDHKLELKTSGNNLKLADPDQGLNVTFSGKTTQIQTGLNEKLPIAQIQGSWLSQHLSRDGVVAIISFCASLVVSLIAWLF